MRFTFFGSFVFALLRGWGSIFSGRRAHRSGAPASAPLLHVRALATGSTRAIAATGAVAIDLRAAAAEAGPSTSSDLPSFQHHRRRQPFRDMDTARCAHRRGVSDRGEQGHRSTFRVS